MPTVWDVLRTRVHVDFSHFAKPRWRPVTCVCTGSRGWFVFELPQQTVPFLNRAGEENFLHFCQGMFPGLNL